MWKWIIVAFLVIVVAVTADAVYHEIARIAGETFNLRLGGLLFDLRPVVFTIWYLLLVIVARWFMSSDNYSSLLSVIFIIFGLACRLRNDPSQSGSYLRRQYLQSLRHCS